MNQFAGLLIFVVLPFLVPQALKKDLGITITYKPRLFAADVTDIAKMGLANRQAVLLDHGKVLEKVKLKQGRGTKTTRLGEEGYSEKTEVQIGWQKSLGQDHRLAYYEWGWYAASSSQSGVVQVFELRDGKVSITQQIDFDMHHGGHAVGASFDPNSRTITVRSVPYESPDGRCCPTYINIVTFRWDGQLFVSVRARRAPLPQDH